MSSRKEREQRKTELLKLIQQQRLDISAARRDWVDATARFDHYALAIVSLRRYFVFGSGLIALWSIRHPRGFGRWIKRGLGAWSTLRLVRKNLPQR